MFTLNLLNVGDKAVIKEISDDSNLKLKLLDLGFVNGNFIECLYLSPFRGLTAYKIMDTVIALRDIDSSCIMVEKYG